MIILKSPMVFGSLKSITLYSDILGSKIMGNYSIIGTRVTSEDLMHMTTQPPEVFVNVENSQSFLNENNFNVDNGVKLELINQLLNRITFYGTDEFTYQDEVFVATVLQKLGITNINEFMSQVRVDIERNSQTQTLINKYFDILEQTRNLVDTEISNIENKGGATVNIDNKYDTELYIQNEIYRRLNTAQYINTVYDYNNSNITENRIPAITDITFIEQADNIQLTQLRQALLAQSAPDVWNQFFGYEAKSLEINELTKENITKRIMVAVLENVMDKVSYMSQSAYFKNVWKNYTPIMYKSSADVIDRFKYYQTTYEGLRIDDVNNYNYSMDRLVGDEVRLADLVLLEEYYDIDEVSEDYIRQEKQNIIVSMLENQNIQKQVAQRYKFLIREKSNDLYSKEIYKADEIELLNKFAESKNFYNLLHKESTRDITMYEKSKESGSESTQPTSERQFETIIEGVAPQTQSQSETIIEGIQKILSENIVQDGMGDNFQNDYITEVLNRYSDIEYDENVSIAENPQFLEQLNNHNVYMKQLLDSREKDNGSEQKRVVVDRKKAMQNALKALENPELLKEEIFENGTTIEKSLPSEIEHILSITDKNTREFYESIIKGDYDKIQQIEIKSNANFQSVEEILNSVKIKTDIETAINKINNIITTIQNDTSVENENTVEYVAYLQNINEQLQSLNTSVDEKLLESTTEKTDAVYHSETENTYEDNKSINIQNVEEIINSIKNETDVENAVSKINNIITLIQQDNTISNETQKNDYIAYLQNVTNELENVNISYDEAQTIFQNELKSAIEKIGKIENTYKDNESINIQNVEEIINSIKNETDVENAISKINNIIITIQHDNTVSNETQKNDYIAYLQNVTNELENINISHDEVQTIFQNELESVIKKIGKIENTYEDNKSTNIQNVEEIVIPVKNEIDKILSNISNTSQVFYDGLISGNKLDEYFTISDRVYNISDIVDGKSDIGIQNVYDEIESIKSESDITHAISRVKSLISELKTVNTVSTQTVVDKSERTVFENTEGISESRQKIHSYVNFLESIVNELESTRIINQAITQNNEVVEKYIHDEVERILMNTLEYDESFIQRENSKHTSNIVERNSVERKVIDSSLKDIFNTDIAGYLDNVVNRMYTERERSISLIHATRESIQEEVVNEITQTVKTDTVNRINQTEEVSKDQVTTKQLTEMKNELIRQSEESITRIVNQNIQTQVHAISDMVYLELEKRLKNEQRRRGY
jgi:hypothetical protein